MPDEREHRTSAVDRALRHHLGHVQLLLGIDSVRGQADDEVGIERREHADTPKVQDAHRWRRAVVSSRQDQGHVVPSQRRPAASPDWHAVEFKRATRCWRGQIRTPTERRCAGLIVASRLADPQLEGREPIPAAVVPIVNDDLAHLRWRSIRVRRQLHRQPWRKLGLGLTHVGDHVVVDAICSNMRLEGRTLDGTQARQLRKCAQWWNGRWRRWQRLGRR